MGKDIIEKDDIAGKDGIALKDDILERSRLLLGDEAIEKLAASRVIVFGAGGVGGYVIEALARTGVGYIEIVDNDTVNVTNINRQIIATRHTVGEYKVDAFKKRIEEINPKIEVKTNKTFYLPETASEFNLADYDYIVDAIDTVAGKIFLIEEANKANTPIISSMGAGNKVNPAAFEVADIYKTSVCPLAKVMRRELKKRGIKSLKVVYSKEEAKKIPRDENGEKVVGSVAFVPSVVGMIIAGEVIMDLVKSGD